MIRIQYVKALCVLGLSATTTWGVLALDVKDGKSDEPACIWNDSRGITEILRTLVSQQSAHRSILRRL